MALSISCLGVIVGCPEAGWIPITKVVPYTERPMRMKLSLSEKRCDPVIYCDCPRLYEPYSAVQPPSTTRAAPVIKLDASEARKTIAPPSSSGRPHRPSEM